MNETTPQTKHNPDPFFENFPSLDPEQVVRGGYSTTRPSRGFKLEMPECVTVLTPQNAYLLHRALEEYMRYLANNSETPKFWVQVQGLPTEVEFSCFGLDH